VLTALGGYWFMMEAVAVECCSDGSMTTCSCYLVTLLVVRSGACS